MLPWSFARVLAACTFCMLSVERLPCFAGDSIEEWDRAKQVREMISTLTKEQRSAILADIQKELAKREQVKKVPRSSGLSSKSSKAKKFDGRGNDKTSVGVAKPSDSGMVASLREAERTLKIIVTDGERKLDDNTLKGRQGEAIVDILRSAYLFCGDDIVDKDRITYWRNDIKKFLDNFGDRSRSIGRLDISKPGMNGPTRYEPLGTAFYVGNGRVVTNRHVVEKFADKDGAGKWRVIPGYSIRVDFAAEFEGCGATSRYFSVSTSRLIVSDDYDAAILDIEGTNFPKQLAVATNYKPKADEVIAVIGYPAPDADVDREEQELVFSSPNGGPPPVYYVKRFQPGKILGPMSNGKKEFQHDASTLGGNSGSPVIRLSDGKVIGLHRHGYAKKYNIAVESEALGTFLSANLPR